MGIFNSIARGLGSLRPLSDAELADGREVLRERYVSAGDVNEADKLHDELHRYDAEMIRRANDACARENPTHLSPGPASTDGTCRTTTRVRLQRSSNSHS